MSVAVPFDDLSAAAVEAAAVELDAVIERIVEVDGKRSLQAIERRLSLALDTATVDLSAVETRRALARCLAIQIFRREARGGSGHPFHGA